VTRSDTAESEAFEVALAALGPRELSVQELDVRLQKRGFSRPARTHALETLLRTGLLDDARYAQARASSLASRGAGDALIRHALASSGVAAEIADAAVAALEPEAERAHSIVTRRGGGPRTARYLSGKGFAEDVVAVVAGRTDEGVG